MVTATTRETAPSLCTLSPKKYLSTTQPMLNKNKCTSTKDNKNITKQKIIKTFNVCYFDFITIHVQLLVTLNTHTKPADGVH